MASCVICTPACNRCRTSPKLGRRVASRWAVSTSASGTERAINHYLHFGQRNFPSNPFFPYREADHLLDKNLGHTSFYRARYLFQEAQRLARARPRDEKMEEMLEDIEEQLRELQDMSPDNIFGGFFGGHDDYSDDDDWEE